MGWSDREFSLRSASKKEHGFCTRNTKIRTGLEVTFEVDWGFHKRFSILLVRKPGLVLLTVPEARRG